MQGQSDAAAKAVTGAVNQGAPVAAVSKALAQAGLPLWQLYS